MIQDSILAEAAVIAINHRPIEKSLGQTIPEPFNFTQVGLPYDIQIEVSDQSITVDPTTDMKIYFFSRKNIKISTEDEKYLKDAIDSFYFIKGSPRKMIGTIISDPYWNAIKAMKEESIKKQSISASQMQAMAQSKLISKNTISKALTLNEDYFIPKGQ